MTINKSPDESFQVLLCSAFCVLERDGGDVLGTRGPPALVKSQLTMLTVRVALKLLDRTNISSNGSDSRILFVVCTHI